MQPLAREPWVGHNRTSILRTHAQLSPPCTPPSTQPPPSPPVSPSPEASVEEREKERDGGLRLDEGLVVGVYIVEKRTFLKRNKNGQSAWSPVNTLRTLKTFFFKCPVGMHEVVYRGVSLEFYLTCINLVEEGKVKQL